MRVKLGDVFDLQMGRTPSRNVSDYWGGVNKWVSIADLSSCNKYIHNTKECVTDKAIQESGMKRVPAHTVLMSFKLSIGKVAITASELYTNEAIMAFIDKGNYPMNVNFIYYLFSGTDWSKGSNKAVKGLTLNKAILMQKCIDLPKLDVQDEVVAKLELIDNIIEKRKQQLEKLDVLVKSQFIEIFGDPIINNHKWQVSTFGKQFSIASGGTPATDVNEYWNNGTIPWIGSNMCQDTVLFSGDGKFITEEGYANSSARWFRSGTVLVALVGATIGKTALLRFDTTTNQNIVGIDVNENKNFSSEFIFYHMQMQYEKFMEIGNGKFKMANQGFIRSLPCMCPPVELQNEFAHFVEQTEKSKSTIKRSLDKLTTLKKALMQKYFG